jgi:glycosyltransferase involved in cell wall biosynthesis
MIEKRVLYVGVEESVHDKRFISELKKRFKVDKIFNLDKYVNIEKHYFSKFDLIVCGPLVETIEHIPESVNVPILGMSHALELHTSNSDRHLLGNILRCRSIIIDCLHSQKILMNELHYNKKSYVFAYGCDYSFFATTRVKYNVNPLICTTRNWYKGYNNSLIVEAAKKLIEEGFNLSLTCVGDGPLLDEEIKKISTSEYLNNFKFLGSLGRKGIRRCFENNWIYISASESDGSSVSLLEALSAGMICIVSDFPSNLEWVENGVNGFVFNLEEPGSLLRIIKKAISLTLEQKEEMGISARISVSQKGNWEVNSKKFMEAVLQTLELV